MKHFIDWDEQWSLHSPYFSEGRVEFPLKPLGTDKTLLMEAGPGFGDLSHPTTHLVLKLMAPLVKGRTILDIGSGSGILSIAASLMGAKEIIGVEIDPEALLHARKNSELNKLKNVHFCLPHEFPKGKSFDGIILMNMIQSEQKVAWESLPNQMFHGELLTSGVLREGRKDYINFAKIFRRPLLQEIQKEDWMGFRFDRFSKSVNGNASANVHEILPIF